MKNASFKRLTQREFNGQTYPSSWFVIDGKQIMINGDWSSEERQKEMDNLIANGSLKAITTVPAGLRTRQDGTSFYSPAFTIVDIKVSQNVAALADNLFKTGLEQRIETTLALEESGVDATEYRQKSRDILLKAEEDKFNVMLNERKAAREAAKKQQAELAEAAKAEAAKKAAATVVEPAAAAAPAAATPVTVGP